MSVEGVEDGDLLVEERAVVGALGGEHRLPPVLDEPLRRGRERYLGPREGAALLRVLLPRGLRQFQAAPTGGHALVVELVEDRVERLPAAEIRDLAGLGVDEGVVGVGLGPSYRIVNSPCILVTGEYGWSANMERS